MKAKGLIVMGAILMMVIAIGCSNSRTTAPVVANDQLAISSDANNGRFDNSDSSIPVIADLKPIWITLRGDINYHGTQCVTLKIGENNYVELDFSINSPNRLPNGTPVQVVGRYASTPGSRCQFIKIFQVSEITILSGENHTIAE